jgi:hypothetical protein
MDKVKRIKLHLWAQEDQRICGYILKPWGDIPEIMKV